MINFYNFFLPSHEWFYEYNFQYQSILSKSVILFINHTSGAKILNRPPNSSFPYNFDSTNKSLDINYQSGSPFYLSPRYEILSMM